MQSRLLFTSILSISLILAYSCTTPTPDDPPQTFTRNNDITDAFDTTRLRYIDSAYTQFVKQGLLPNAVTFVAHRGRIVHHAAYGWRNKEAGLPCRPDDIFRIASQTKAIAVVALMTLWEEGRFQLDDPIKKYLPEFTSPRVLVDYDPLTGRYTTRPASTDITIRHLITHTSGISHQGIYLNIAHQAGVPPLNSLDSITLATMVNRIATLPLAHDPGTQFTYSMNIDVLGRLAEVLSGQSIDRFINERILQPLGMEDTHFYLPEDKEQRLVTLYQYDQTKGLTRSNDTLYQTFPHNGARMLMSTGTGLSGTIEDYARFCQMVLNGGTFNGKRIIGRKTLEMMQHNSVGDMRGDIGFGMAWDVFRPQYAHRTIVSQGTMRWGGMFGTDYVIDPKEELIVLFYTNLYPNETGIDFKSLMHNLTYQALR